MPIFAPCGRPLLFAATGVGVEDGVEVTLAEVLDVDVAVVLEDVLELDVEVGAANKRPLI